jgi:hypothetical protein
MSPYKEVLSDFQLEWEELNKKLNIILDYEQCHKGLLKRSCPPVCFSDCNCTNSTPGYHKAKMEWQVRIHLASPQYAIGFMATIIVVLQLKI